MAVYIDWTFYSTEYLGDTISEEDFPRLAMRASTVIDRITFNRVAAIITADAETAVILKIQKATCAVAEEMQEQLQSTGGQAIASERVGNHSVSYVQTKDMQTTPAKKLSIAAALYLGSTYLLFPGFYSGEYGSVVDDEN